MADLSVIIPARQERYLNKTLKGLFEHLKSDYEIIVILDGANEERLENVRYIYNRKSKGMRTAINQAVEIATGKYLMKLDAHCMIDSGMDIKLLKEHQPKWVQIPTRKRLEPVKWEIDEPERPSINYMALTSDLIGYKNGRRNRDPELAKKLLDSTQTFQGSCYLIRRDFFNKIGLLDDKNFNGSGHEAQEVGIKVLGNGGKIIRNKKTWYAHARIGRFFSTDRTKSRNYIHKLAEEYEFNRKDI